MSPKKSSALTSEVRHLSSSPKADPCFTRAQKQFDAFLLLIIAIMIFIGFRGAMKDRAHRMENTGNNAESELAQAASK